MLSCFQCKVHIALYWVHAAYSMSVMNSHAYFMDNSETDTEVANLMSAKSYVPNDRDLPKTTLIKNIENDATYLLSKLSDEQLIKLLNEQPAKNEYFLSDIVKIAVGNTFKEDDKVPNGGHNKINNRFRSIGGKDKAQPAYFRLENKEVDPLNVKNEASYAALQKLNTLLYNKPQNDEKSEEDEEKKELLFDVLVAQLKTLCCKRSQKKRRKQQYKYLNNFLPKLPVSKTFGNDLHSSQFSNEYMFLIINEEIRSNGSEELVSVDPESLEKNSSVLLLGPITTPLTDSQLKIVMTRISNELSKPEYIQLLQQLSEGSLSSANINFLKNVMPGSQTRRYIKPHRCNHQSKLARIYGGPKWLLCTGYLNINTPSLYD